MKKKHTHTQNLFKSKPNDVRRTKENNNNNSNNKSEHHLLIRKVLLMVMTNSNKGECSIWCIQKCRCATSVRVREHCRLFTHGFNGRWVHLYRFEYIYNIYINRVFSDFMTLELTQCMPFCVNRCMDSI